MGLRNRNRAAFGLTAFTMVALVMVGASAAGPPTIPLGTLTAYSVVAASTVTNTGNTTLNGNVGLWPGTSVTGFPPGTASVIDAANSAALQAQTDLTAAYLNAANRTATGLGDLGGMTLTGGIYGVSGLTGTVTLDGAGDPGSVFVFQSASTLITASGSQVNLINGAQGCNVFWQVGSSATLGTNSMFRGTILALTSITVTTGVTVHGRALARNGAVTLDSNVFVQPSCDLAPPVTTTSGPPPTTTSTTVLVTTIRPATTQTTTTRPTPSVPPTSTVPRTTVPRATSTNPTSPTGTTSTVTSSITTAAPTTTGGPTATPTTISPPLGDAQPVAPVLLVVVGGTLGLLLGCAAVFARNRVG